ncbi:transglutaminase family protein [Chloroflexota bacterium]
MEQLEKYLKPTFTIDSNSRPIRAKADELTRNQNDVASKAKSLFYFVRDQIKYIMYPQISREEYFKASKTLQKGEGYCVQKAVLLTTLARAADIPARLGFVDIVNHLLPQKYIALQGTNLFIYHGFTELHLNGKWIKATPAFDFDMCNENQIIPIEFDGENDTLFHPVNQEGKPHIEYTKFHGSYDDLPYTEIINACREVYGQKFVELMSESSELS